MGRASLFAFALAFTSTVTFLTPVGVTVEVLSWELEEDDELAGAMLPCVVLM